jgi:hypothetical protein
VGSTLLKTEAGSFKCLEQIGPKDARRLSGHNSLKVRDAVFSTTFGGCSVRGRPNIAGVDDFLKQVDSSIGPDRLEARREGASHGALCPFRRVGRAP